MVHPDRSPRRTSTRARRRSVALRLAVVAAGAASLAAGCAAPPPPPPPAPSAAAPGTVHEIVHPVGGRSSVTDTFGAPRSGGRTHEGQDVIAAKHTPVVAVSDGRITAVRHDSSGLSGNYLQLTADDGWTYLYIHLNNDTPGTDDGSNVYERAFADGVIKGQRVKAGEVVGWVGDSGNAESTSPHLHFEARDAAGTLVNAYPSLVAARRFVRSEADRAADAPVGVVDSVARNAQGTVDVSGWAVDRHVATSVKVTVYVGGNPALTVTADGARPDVGAAFPGQGDRHGYRVQSVPAPPGARVCAIAHSVGGGGGSRLGCATA